MTTNPKYKKIIRHYKYVLIEKYYFIIPDEIKITKDSFCASSSGRHYAFVLSAGKLVVNAGYAWDGPSGPTIDGEDSVAAALVHDVLYQGMRDGAISQEARPHVDRLFYQMLLDHGMNPARAWLWFWGVRLFAGFAAKKRDEL